ncbi:glycosyltransferase [Corallibacter sp.]|uniref:glycosyltransferase n=1 Tax=Corallibacter sp. TaxID=2038084 RepID=UPI003A8D0C76
MKLAIISHTEHYKKADGTIVGWGPTINEINHLLEVFDTIYHVAMLHETEAPLSALPYTSDRIKFVSLKPLGGRTLQDKFSLLKQAPEVIRVVKTTLKEVDYFQFRAPTGIGVYVIPYISLFVKKTGWFKYAGNWNQKNPPLGYRLQRGMLKIQSRKVTINGTWKNQPNHCITFENPCLKTSDVTEGIQIQETWQKPKALSFCYVGRLEDEKGVRRIIKAFTNLSTIYKEQVSEVHLVGDGQDMEAYKGLAQDIGVRITFHGFLSRNQVFKIFKQSDVFVMPTTASEGFPKVIAEAANFGCIPIVSNISSIGQYIKNNENGILLETVTENHLKNAIENILEWDNVTFKKVMTQNRLFVKDFTYEHYNFKVKKLLGL